MRFALLSKTHFTHANKLVRDGNRTVFNEGKVPLIYDENNKEGARILEDGVLCCVYREELWEDAEAMLALMNADNDDADINLFPNFVPFIHICPNRMTKYSPQTPREQAKNAQGNESCR